MLRKRPYISWEKCVAVLAAPLRQTVQPDGRVRWWGRVVNPRNGAVHILRVVTLDDGETIHNAFFDRTYREDAP